MHDPYYSGLVNAPFPLNAIVVLFIFPYMIWKSKRMNNFIMAIEHILLILILIFPIVVLQAHIALIPTFLKCSANKLYLIKVSNSTSKCCSNILNFVSYLVFGLIIIYINHIIDVFKFFLVLYKPEKDMQCRF